jgi:hypothetical protein
MTTPRSKHLERELRNCEPLMQQVRDSAELLRLVQWDRCDRVIHANWASAQAGNVAAGKLILTAIKTQMRALGTTVSPPPLPTTVVVPPEDLHRYGLAPN